MKIKRAHALLLLFMVLAPFVLPAQDMKGRDVYRAITINRTITIGISKNYPPLNFNSGEKGVEIEMAHKLGDFLDVTVKLVPLNLDQYIPALQKGQVDIVIAGMSRDLKRARAIWFSVPYLSVTPAVLASKKSLPQTNFGDEFQQDPIKTIWDLKRVSSFSFAVKKGSTYESLLEEHFPDMARVVVGSNEEGMDLLTGGKVQGFVHDSLYLHFLYINSAKLRSSFELLQGGSQMESLCIGLPFGEVILKNQIDTFLLELIRQGQIEKWLKTYNIK